MSDTLDVFVENLQQQVFDEARDAWGEAGFQLWQHPLHSGALENPDSYARITGKCGDTMGIYLIFENGRVKTTTYTTDGCGSSTICGSFTAGMAIGKTPDELAEITGEKVLAKIGTFPEDEQHCAFLAVEALQAALDQYMQTC